VKENVVRRLVVFVPRRAQARAPFATGTVVHYVAIDGPRSSEGDAPVALLPKAAVVDIAFDCADVFSAAIAAPKLAETKLRLALPTLLEDRLLASAEDSHFAFEPPRAPGAGTTIADAPKLAVAAIDRGLLTRVLDVCNEAGVRPRSAFSEIYTVPAPAAGRLSVRISRGRGVARVGRHDGFGFDLVDGEVPATLQLALRQLGATSMTVFGSDVEAATTLGDALGIAVDDSGSNVDLAAIDDAVNLLQGPFSAAGRLSFGPRITKIVRSGALKAPLAWLAGAIVVATGGMNAYWFKLDAEAHGLRSQMASAFRSTFPDATAVVDPVLQTKRQMSALRARGGVASVDDFSVLNAQVGQLFSVAPVGAVTGVEYHDGALKLALKPGVVDNPALQNTLRAQAVQQGLNLRFDADGTARVTPLGS